MNSNSGRTLFETGGGCLVIVATGGVSTRIVRVAGSETLPASSVAVTLRTLVPSARSAAVPSQLPISLTEPVPTTRSETLIVIVVNSSPRPLTGTDVEGCTLFSAGLVICGAAGRVVSIVKLRLAVSIGWPSISAATSKEYDSSASAVGGR